MAIPVWVPGQVLTASDVNNWFVPNAVTKPSNQSISNATLANDTALVLPVVANASYIFDMMLAYDGGTQGSADIKWSFTVPASATMVATGFWLGTGGGNITGNSISAAATVNTAGTNGAGTQRGIRMSGTLITVGTSGNLQLQWAQNTGNGTATIVHAGSYLTLQRTS